MCVYACVCVFSIGSSNMVPLLSDGTVCSQQRSEVRDKNCRQDRHWSCPLAEDEVGVGTEMKGRRLWRNLDPDLTSV